MSGHRDRSGALATGLSRCPRRHRRSSWAMQCVSAMATVVVRKRMYSSAFWRRSRIYSRASLISRTAYCLCIIRLRSRWCGQGTQQLHISCVCKTQTQIMRLRARSVRIAWTHSYVACCMCMLANVPIEATNSSRLTHSTEKPI